MYLLHVSLQQQTHFTGCFYFLITFGAQAEQSNRKHTGAKANNKFQLMPNICLTRFRYDTSR